MLDQRIRVSPRQWLVPAADGFVIGRRATVVRRISGGPELERILQAILQRLEDRPRSLTEMCGDLGHLFAPALVVDAVEQFFSLGILEFEPTGTEHFNAGADGASGLRRYLDSQADNSDASLAKLADSQVLVFGDEGIVTVLVAMLRDGQIGRMVIGPRLFGREIPFGATEGEPGSTSRAAPGITRLPEDVSADDLRALCAGSEILIGCAGDPERMRWFPILNRLALAQRRPWLSVAIDADTVLLGPLFVPGETACFRCLELREESRLPHRTEFLAFKERITSGWRLSLGDAMPSAQQVAAGLAATEALRIVARLSFPATYQTMISLDLRTFASESHTLLRVPFCDACGPHLTRPFRKAWNI